MSLRRPAAGATTPALARGEYVVDELLRQSRPVPHGHSNPNRYRKRNVCEGWEKQKRLEQIEAALRERIEVIAREIDVHPGRFRAIESVKDLLDVEAPSIEVVD